ncbi:pentapeptide repeat-containing protein [Occultella glacieicola]|uniref:Pentapeptide repeat-containing protein n=1 Tax=Occultella glacieicola TaxID=2518684 RepID=A0ABY2E1U0_9MICO|nr:pentapeptide repeat-containing protein [Occultella glacieicola]TDE90347.1 pentapeptide repeat-containing protein [Occultella glacieicola]
MATSGDIDLRADCARCVGLCCVALAFSRSADFAFDKAAGDPCRNLLADHRCAVHAGLRSQGMAGCTTYDCFGAGQHVTEATFAGRTWRDGADTAAAMFAAFGVMRRLHEALWYLNAARALDLPRALARQVRLLISRVEEASAASAPDLAGVDVDAVWAEMAEAALRASAHIRASAPGPRVEFRGADLAGADLRGADLRGANLRGAAMIGADLRGARLHRADVIGADLRGADVRGTDLADVLFLTQPQVAAATGDARTALPGGFARPGHW